VPERRGGHLNRDGAVETVYPVPLPIVPSDALSRAIMIPPVPRGVHAARTWVEETVTKWQVTQRLDDLELAASELVTNAIRHAQDGSSVALLLMYAAGTLRLEVRDHDPLTLPLKRSPGPTDTGGWGLVLVDQVTDRWGVRATETGKAVWCEFDIIRPRSGRWRAPVASSEGGRSDA
jgi:anti-sigma regulatory factor (Ser/Thr protein kinase)